MKQFIENKKNLSLSIRAIDNSSQVIFTSEQQEIINIFNQQVKHILKPSSVIPKRTVVVQGKAGSGKNIESKTWNRFLCFNDINWCCSYKH